jgi:hypothetical protein
MRNIALPARTRVDVKKAGGSRTGTPGKHFPDAPDTIRTRDRCLSGLAPPQPAPLQAVADIGLVG